MYLLGYAMYLAAYLVYCLGCLPHRVKGFPVAVACQYLPVTVAVSGGSVYRVKSGFNRLVKLRCPFGGLARSSFWGCGYLLGGLAFAARWYWGGWCFWHI